MLFGQSSQFPFHATPTPSPPQQASFQQVGLSAPQGLTPPNLVGPQGLTPPRGLGSGLPWPIESLTPPSFPNSGKPSDYYGPTPAAAPVLKGPPEGWQPWQCQSKHHLKEVEALITTSLLAEALPASLLQPARGSGAGNYRAARSPAEPPQTPQGCRTAASPNMSPSWNVDGSPNSWRADSTTESPLMLPLAWPVHRLDREEANAADDFTIPRDRGGACPALGNMRRQFPPNGPSKGTTIPGLGLKLTDAQEAKVAAVQAQFESTWKMLQDSVGEVLAGNSHGLELFSSCSKVPGHRTDDLPRPGPGEYNDDNSLDASGFPGRPGMSPGSVGESFYGEFGLGSQQAPATSSTSSSQMPKSWFLRTCPPVHAAAQGGGDSASVLGACEFPASSSSSPSEPGRRRMLVPHEVAGLLAQHKCGISSLKGNKNTAPNQDRAICASLGGGAVELLGVFDGHGEHGHFAAELCNEMLPKLFLRSLPRPPDLNPQDASEAVIGWQEAACHAFMETHVILEELTVQYVDRTVDVDEAQVPLLDARASGATATLLAITSSRALVAHTGDSRAVMGTRPRNGIGDRWRTVDLTEDHKPELPEEQARIERAGAQTIFSGHPPNQVARIYTNQQTWPMINMTRSIGDLHAHTQGLSAEAEVHVAESFWDPAFEEAVILVCSDGIWDVFSSEGAVEFVCEQRAAGLDPAAGLAQEAFARWAHRGLPQQYSDDITAIVKFA